jgi:CDGSH-type Zn-finger protein
MTTRGGRAAIVVTRNGPYEVDGGIPLATQTIVTDAEGNARDGREGPPIQAPVRYRLCRCGHSSSKPFCDDTHLTVGFDGTETASRRPYIDAAERTKGPTLELTDQRSLCADARFCDPDGTIWRRIAGTGDAGVRTTVEAMASRCPSGRLVVRDQATDKPLEPVLEPSIGLVEDPTAGVSGPLWVRGRIPIRSEDGAAYEVRNRVTLCRCGASKNKPFCDGSHGRVGFQDGLLGVRR